MAIFTRYKFKERKGLGKFLGRAPKDNALSEISDLLIEYENNVLEIPFEKFEGIARKYRVNMKHDFHEFRISVFRKYVQFCYEDHVLDHHELEALRHLRSILYLSNKDVYHILEREKRRRYLTQVKRAVWDGKITRTEKDILDQLRDSLLLDRSIAKQLLHRSATVRYEEAVKHAARDERITDDEMRVLEAIASNLGLERPHLAAATHELFERYRNYWLIENGRLPVLRSGTRLQSGERVHFKATVKWLERNLETYAHEPEGVSHRVRYSHAYVFTHKNLEPAPITSRAYEFIDYGIVELTNKRLVFTGDSCNQEVLLHKVLNVFPHTNGVDVQIPGVRSPFLEFSQDIDLFSMTLNSLIGAATR